MPQSCKPADKYEPEPKKWLEAKISPEKARKFG